MASHNPGYTVYLTEQEAERIRNTVKDRLKKTSEVVGHAREPRDSKTATSQAFGAALMADMGSASDADMTQTKGQGGSLPAVAVGQPYPPSIVPLRDLEPMKIADLKIDTHHRGRRLTVKRVSPVVTLTARSWTMVQDEDKDETERLEMCLHKSRHGEDVLESVSIFIIKEPYFTLTDQGEATIRVDHPSDLIVCRDENANHTTSADGEYSQAENAAAAEKAATKCKDEGNAALKEKDLPLAHSKYTEGLKIAGGGAMSQTKSDLARDISRNRAHVNLLLNQLDEAKSDAKASLLSRNDERSQILDSKAYYRAGCAAYNLGEYDESKNLFEERQKLLPGDKEAGSYLRNIERRLSEQETGSYDLKKIKSELSRARPRVDAGSFIRNTEPKDSPGRGHGLFVTRHISAGEIFMCEKAFCVVWGHEKEALTAMTYDLRDNKIRVSPVGLSKAIVQKLLNNPSQIKKVMGLYGDYQGDGSTASMTEDGPVVDSFRVHDIMSRNGFGPGSQYGEEGASSASTGIWVQAAYINHSCIANTTREFIGDLLVLRATQPIAAGEEIFISYEKTSDYDARQKALMTTWGFECSCVLCTTEKADDPALRKKRQELASEADQFVERENWTNAKRLTIAKAQRLARALDDTYDSKRYNKSVPRLATQKIRDWLASASPRR